MKDDEFLHEDVLSVGMILLPEVKKSIVQQNVASKHML